MTAILYTPLNSFHIEQGARFVDFSGWNMPVQYTSILEEHKAVRTAVGLFDVSHMGEFHVSGQNAGRFLDKLLVNICSDMPVGKAVYSPMCAEDGGVIDDLIVYRTEEGAFLVCVNASNIEKDFTWFTQHAERWALDVRIEDHSANYALLALQGPKAAALLETIGLDSAVKLKRFEHTLTSFAKKAIRICRTGYTGEDGFEIYSTPEVVEPLARVLWNAGKSMGLKLCGLGCRDSLRLEAGYPLYGHELSSRITPLEANLAWTVKFHKEDFMGKDALIQQKQSGIPRRVVHFILEGRRIAREGTPIVNAEHTPVGKVLSGTLSPMLGKPIGSALVSADAREKPLFVDLRGNLGALTVGQPPLHKVK